MTIISLIENHLWSLVNRQDTFANASLCLVGENRSIDGATCLQQEDQLFVLLPAFVMQRYMPVWLRKKETIQEIIQSWNNQPFQFSRIRRDMMHCNDKSVILSFQQIV